MHIISYEVLDFFFMLNEWMEIGIQENSLSAHCQSRDLQFDTGQTLEEFQLNGRPVAIDSTICENILNRSPSQTRILKPSYQKQHLIRTRILNQIVASCTPVSPRTINPPPPLTTKKRGYMKKLETKDGLLKTQSSTRTSDPVSTSNGSKFFAWWTKCSKEVSAKLWLPTKTDYADSDTTSSTTCSSRMVRPSPCCITEVTPNKENFQTTFWPSLPIFPPYTTEKKDTPLTSEPPPPPKKKSRLMDKKLMNPKALKVRLLPPKHVKEKWKKWIGSARNTYNSALYLWKQATSNHQKVQQQQIKTSVTKKENIEADGKQWLTETPYSIRGNSVNQLWKNITAAFQARKKKKKESCKKSFIKMKYLRKNKFSKESVTIETTKIDFQIKYSHVKIFDSVVPLRDSTQVKDFLSALVKRSERIPKTLNPTGLRYNKDCRLMLDRRTQRWYLIVTYDDGELVLPRQIKRQQQLIINNNNNQVQRKQWVAIDSGVRVKSTFYSPEGIAGEIDSCFKDDISSLAKKYTEAQNKWVESRVQRGKSKQKTKARQTMARIHSKIEGLRRIHHYTAINYLMDNYQNVLLPDFKVSEMTHKKNPNNGRKRKISKCTVKDIMTYGHYQFKNRLLDRGGLDKRVFICKENHTTKTCGVCFTQNPNVGSSKLFKCTNPKCGLIADRDLHAARNILLKHTIPPSA